MRVGPLSVCSRVWLLPLGVPPTPAPAMPHIRSFPRPWGSEGANHHEQRGERPHLMWDVYRRAPGGSGPPSGGGGGLRRALRALAVPLVALVVPTDGQAGGPDAALLEAPDGPPRGLAPQGHGPGRAGVLAARGLQVVCAVLAPRPLRELRRALEPVGQRRHELFVAGHDLRKRGQGGEGYQRKLGGFWDRKNCVPKMAKSIFSFISLISPHRESGSGGGSRCRGHCRPTAMTRRGGVA